MATCAVTYDLEKHLSDSDKNDRKEEAKAMLLEKLVNQNIEDINDTGFCEIHGEIYDLATIIAYANEMQMEDISNVLLMVLKGIADIETLESVMYRILCTRYTDEDIESEYEASFEP